MAEVDPVTGFPKGETDKVPTTEKYLRLSEQKAKSDRLQHDLNSETGQTLINKIKEQMLKRVNKLIDDDAECSTLKRLLAAMAIDINMGERAVENLIRLVVKK